MNGKKRNSMSRFANHRLPNDIYIMTKDKWQRDMASIKDKIIKDFMNSQLLIDKLEFIQQRKKNVPS